MILTSRDFRLEVFRALLLKDLRISGLEALAGGLGFRVCRVEAWLRAFRVFSVA